MSRTCRICGGPLALRHRGGGAIDPAAFAPTCHAVGAHGDLYACGRCGTVHQPALPAGAALVDLYRGMTDPAYLAEEAGRRATARRLLERLERHVAPGRLLEVGCGHGLLLDEARVRGWTVRGLEPSATAAAHARERLRLDVRAETLEALGPAADGPFDAVVMADVLEHLDDPVRAVRACAALLAPAGALLLVTPDPASAVARLAGGRWWGYLPAHTFLIPRRTLRAMLAREGLQPVDDTGLRRTFSLGYWAHGLGERAGTAGRAVTRRRRASGRSGAPGNAPSAAGRSTERLAVVGRALARAPLTLSLGDERVIVARPSAG